MGPKWRATVDEDGHYSFAVTLRCRSARSNRQSCDCPRFCTTPHGQIGEWAPVPLFLPTGLFQQARKFVHPMPIAQPEWSQGVSGKLFQLAHLIDT